MERESHFDQAGFARELGFDDACKMAVLMAYTRVYGIESLIVVWSGRFSRV